MALPDPQKSRASPGRLRRPHSPLSGPAPPDHGRTLDATATSAAPLTTPLAKPIDKSRQAPRPAAIPGGPWIDALASFGDPQCCPPSNFHAIKSSHPDATAEPRFDFSFSGIKTAVLRYVQNQQPCRIGIGRPAAPPSPAQPGADLPPPLPHLCDRQTLDLIASFQARCCRRNAPPDLRRRHVISAWRGTALVSGGVAANRELRTRFTAEAESAAASSVAFPSSRSRPTTPP